MAAIHEHATPGERKTARLLIDLCLARGYAVSVSDGECWTLKRSSDRLAIIAALATTGEDLIRIYPADDLTAKCSGAFLLIWGNFFDGSELIADHTDNEICAGICSAIENAIIYNAELCGGAA